MASKGAATRVVIAGFTSRVAQLITSYLLRQPDLEIVGICRNAAKVSEEVARNPKITVREAEYSDSKALRNALHGASVCICCYFGPEPVMLEGQFLLIDSCIAENVPRYIASDFSFDYRGLKIGDFPFKDFQAKVGDYLAEKERQGQIKAVHVLNGGFFEAVLFPFMGLLDVQGKRFRCWGTGDEPWDMTSMEDTAMFTAKVASDHSATGVLKVRGDSKSVKEMASIFERHYGVSFALEQLGSIEELQEKMIRARETTPEDVGSWLGLHYNYFTINGSTLLGDSDNARYPDITVKDLEGFLQQHALEEVPKLFR